MTHRRTSDLERRLTELEEQTTREPDPEFDLSPLSDEERRVLDRAFGPDESEREAD
jgi:hypothetical protein